MKISDCYNYISPMDRSPDRSNVPRWKFKFRLANEIQTRLNRKKHWENLQFLKDINLYRVL